MKIQILGTGCPKCRLLEKGSREALDELGIDAEIEKITDMNTMMDMGMLVSPGFAIDGDLLHMGKVLTSDQIVKILRTYQKEETA
ncbi:MAG: MTH895/ArsE family thioredoxin-like protein [Alkalispirochaeta sp.]